MGLFSRKKRGTTDDPDDMVKPDSEREDGPASDQGAASPLEEFGDLVDREWARLANAGVWWTGGERVAIAGDARLAARGEESSGVLPPPVEEATRRIAVTAADIRGDDVDRWEADGLDPYAYVEVVGIVSRLMALDTASFGLGLDLRELPDPIDGDTAPYRPDEAAVTTGWAPTIGPATAPSTLSAVPPEAEAMFDLHGVLYATMDEMFDMQFAREGLTRPQIELVAARTSSLNDCFY